MSDPTAQSQPSPEELQAYLEQLRAADVTEVVVQAFNILSTGANVKLGREDARVVIDALDALTTTVDGRIEGEILQQMRNGVAQLKTAQVEAEREEAGRAGDPAGQGAGPASGSGEAPGNPQSGAADQAPSAPPGGPQGEQKVTDRLWIPGRGPAG